MRTYPTPTPTPTPTPNPNPNPNPNPSLNPNPDPNPNPHQVLHNDPRGTLAVGCGGPGLGVGPYLRPEIEGGSCHERITPSLVLSLSARQVSMERG